MNPWNTSVIEVLTSILSDTSEAVLKLFVSFHTVSYTHLDVYKRQSYIFIVSFFDKKQLRIRLIPMLKKIKKYTISIWIIALAIFWIYVLNHREILDPKNFAALIQWFWSGAIIVYGLVFLFRWILLVPSTPLILVGMLLFPNSPHTVFIISMMSIVFSSLVIYRFSDLLWLDEYF